MDRSTVAIGSNTDLSGWTPVPVAQYGGVLAQAIFLVLAPRAPTSCPRASRKRYLRRRVGVTEARMGWRTDGREGRTEEQKHDVMDGMGPCPLQGDKPQPARLPGVVMACD
ncbi:unnamed protein product [Calypogeia fissa]